ncbi:MAG: AAA family ATPase [Bacteroidota bacterium]
MQQPRTPLRRRRHPLAGLDPFIRSCYPLIYVSSFEERRFIQAIEERYGNHRTIFHWTYTKGLVNLKRDDVHDPKTIGDPLVALNIAEKIDAAAIFIFSDLHSFLNDASSSMKHATIRMLRDIYSSYKAFGNTQKTVILLSPLLMIPPELEKEVLLYDFPLPNSGELEALLERHIATQGRMGATVSIEPEDRQKLLDAALGLTLDEADNAFNAAFLSDNRIDASDIGHILAEKRLIIKKSGILEYFPAEEGMDSIGGLETLKDWLLKRRRAFTAEARAFGLPQPKGIMLLGVQGCGKSLAAKAIANAWSLPLLRFDIGKVFEGLIGSSEENVRRAIKTAESIAPCIFWIDEIDKGFSGMQSSGSVDAGVTSRVFGSFITWMQEKKAPVFVVATANNIHQLPPELLRKGRFDEIFFVDLPSARERKAIWEIHLRKRQRDPERFALEQLVELTAGHSGAEIEQALISALFEAFDERMDVTDRHLLQAAERSVPLSVTMREQVDELRQWAKQRTVRASADA